MRRSASGSERCRTSVQHLNMDGQVAVVLADPSLAEQAQGLKRSDA